VTSPPKPNTLALSWFFGEYQKKTLVLQPKYQRNPIWSLGQKCFLIDSLISGCPIPQVYININTVGSGAEKITTYEVVDGQQRLRTILEFISGEWSLLGGIEKSYPVSAEYVKQVGRRYSELPDNLQNAIWDYPLAVQEIRGWDDFAIRAMFRRLNYVNERLNAQELRHSQYFGEFNSAVEHLARNEFWDEIKLFSRRDSERMKDVEFISELFVIVLDGIQEGQSTLDSFYASYDVVFPNRNRLIARFKQVIESLTSIRTLIATSRFHKKADFYALFAACVERVKTNNAAIDLLPHVEALMELAVALDGDPEEYEGDARAYYNSVAEGANKAPKRRIRRDILLKII
jgi:hypothetical protein